ncbi:MAG TPA: DinB family protein [Thermomicrobiales bacterium]|nr:DinB family protein [Thermomicrobiales bacterium]
MDENERLIVALTQTLNLVAKRISPQRDESLVNRAPARGEWSVRDIIAHLRDHEAVAFAKLHLMATSEVPDFRHATLNTGVVYDPHDSVFIVMSQFRRLRHSTLSLLIELPPDAWRRAARDVDNRAISIRDLAESLLRHDREHVARIDEVLIARGALPHTVRPLVNA